MNNISGVQLTNGFNLSGTAKEALRYIQNILERIGCGLFIDNKSLKIFKKGTGEKIKAVRLSSNTGLLEAPKLTDNTEEDTAVAEGLTKRVIFRSILNYKIIPNGYVDIQSNHVKGTFIVDKCSFKGDNFGGKFEVSGEGIGI